VTLLWCGRCRTVKPVEEFGLHRGRRSGRQQACRSCRVEVAAASYLSTRDRHNPKRAVWTARNVAANQGWVLGYLSTHPCVDCGLADVRVLEFDHVAGKDAGVSVLIRATTVAKLAAEVARCDVGCANCHRVRTYVRAGSYRQLAWLALQSGREAPWPGRGH